MSKEYKHWNTEKKLIPVMIRTYCRGNHKTERKAEGVKERNFVQNAKNWLNTQRSDWKNVRSRETRDSALIAKFIATNRNIVRR